MRVVDTFVQARSRQEGLRAGRGGQEVLTEAGVVSGDEDGTRADAVREN